MAGTSFSLSADDDGAAALIRGLLAVADDLSPVMDEIGGSLTASTQHRFERGAGPGGVPWPQSRRAQEQGGQTLVDSRRLRDAITHRPGRDSVEVGTAVLYAGIHQFGGTIKMPARRQTIYRSVSDMQSAGAAPFVKRSRATFASDHDVKAHEITMPARPFLGLDDDDRAEVKTILTKHLVRAGREGAR